MTSLKDLFTQNSYLISSTTKVKHLEWQRVEAGTKVVERVVQWKKQNPVLTLNSTDLTLNPMTQPPLLSLHT